MPFNDKQIRDFWAKVRIASDDECWEWSGARNAKGYGVKRNAVARGKAENIQAHRMSWIVFNSEVPDGLLVLHRCDNPSCVNPAHLFLGTHKDNMDDKMSKGRGVAPPLSPLKFTPEQCDQIRVMHGVGQSMRAIAREFNTTHSVVRRVLRGEGRYDSESN
jgi:hypothetical protein